MTLMLKIATHSEIGPVRKNNQDSGYASPHLLVVADGMGGAAAGDLASAVAIDAIREADALASGEQMLEVLASALHEANDRIADLVDADYALEGMGTTVTGVLFDGSQFGLAHIGDSRAYLMHDSRLERLTHDHSWVQSLVDDGKINASDAAVHPHRSLLLKVLNGHPANDPDLTMVKVVAGDRLLICSDGLCGLVDDPVIEKAMRATDIDEALRRLVDEALAEGGIDNITVVLADVVESAPTAGVLVLGAAAERDIPSVRTRTRSHGGRSSRPAAGAGVTHGTGALPADGGPPRSARSEEATSLDSPITDSPTIDSATTDSTTTGGGGDDEARYNPQPPHNRRLVRSLLGFLVLLLVAGAGLSSAYAWTRTQFFVGAAGKQVAIFQGLSDSVPGIPLSHVYEVQPLLVDTLPPYYQARVRANISVNDLAAAHQTVGELAEAARRCALQPAGQPATASSALTSSPTATPPPTPVATTTPQGRVTVAPRPTVRPTTSPRATVAATTSPFTPSPKPAPPTTSPRSATPGTSVSGLPGNGQSC